tara:strand:- start:46 stop:417 length:372 start_codon:yes stop_codon:yes gene_type:complete
MIEEAIKANTEALRDLIDILCKLKILQNGHFEDPRQLKIDFDAKSEETQKPIQHPTAELLTDDQKTLIRKKITIDLKAKGVDTKEFADVMKDLGYEGLSSVKQGHYQELLKWIKEKENEKGVA